MDVNYCPDASYLWLCALVSRALRGGVGDPWSVALRTSRLFLSGRQRPWRVSIGESTRFLGGSEPKKIEFLSCCSCVDREKGYGAGVLTEVVSGREILVFTARVSLLPVQQEVVDHLLLVLPAEPDAEGQRNGTSEREGTQTAFY